MWNLAWDICSSCTEVKTTLNERAVLVGHDTSKTKTVRLHNLERERRSITKTKSACASHRASFSADAVREQLGDTPHGKPRDVVRYQRVRENHRAGLKREPTNLLLKENLARSRQTGRRSCRG